MTVLLITLAACARNNDKSLIVLETTGYADSTKIYLVDTETTVDIDSGYIVNN